jgi:hypothetical protein
MKKLDHILNVYSRRGKPAQPFAYGLPSTFRNRILILCRDTFSNYDHDCSPGDYLTTFWNEIHQALTLQHGRPHLSFPAPFTNPSTDAATFLLSCKDEEFLDFVEYIFKVKCLFHVVQDNNEFVARVNQLFAMDALGYELTNFVVEERPGEGLHGGTAIVTVAWPQVIKKDDQVIHETAIKPALQFLSDPTYKLANLEYLEALEDYRKEDWGNCLTMCGSTFESVMKIICEKKKWKYSQDDTAGPLVKTVISNAKLEQHFEQPLIYIATLRNRFSKSHGAGVQPKKVTPAIALFGLNLTASAILFLLQEIK